MCALVHPGDGCPIASSVSPHRDLTGETSYRTGLVGLSFSLGPRRKVLFGWRHPGEVCRTHHGYDELYPIRK